MGTMHEYVPESFIKTLEADLPGFGNLTQRHQFHLAKLVWESGLKHREHRKHDECMSIGYKELERRFGRDKFDPINNAIRIFDVSPNWDWKCERDKNGNATRHYELTPAAKMAKEGYLMSPLTGEDRLVYLENNATLKTLRSVPVAISSKINDEPNGVTASVWRGCKVTNRVPIDLDRLHILREQLLRMMSNQWQGDLFFNASTNDIQRRLESACQILHLAHSDTVDKGFLIHRYAECCTGRLYAKGVSFQSAPRLVREAALSGMFDYDIENCHYAIFHQLAERNDYTAHAVLHYLANKREVRHGIAKRIGITLGQAKHCLVRQ